MNQVIEGIKNLGQLIKSTFQKQISGCTKLERAKNYVTKYYKNGGQIK